MKVIVSQYPHNYETVEAASRVRDAVFGIEQGVDGSVDFDGLDYDKKVAHVVVFDETKPVATGRVVVKDGTARIGRVAVLKDYRGKGLGVIVMEHLEKAAADTGLEAVELHAQKHAAAFYEKMGYIPFGNEYLEAGIPHQSMRKALA